MTGTQICQVWQAKLTRDRSGIISLLEPISLNMNWQLVFRLGMLWEDSEGGLLATWAAPWVGLLNPLQPTQNSRMSFGPQLHRMKYVSVLCASVIQGRC